MSRAVENLYDAARALLTFSTSFQNDTGRARTTHNLSFQRTKIPTIIMFTGI
jgi:hypothetical protein